MPIMDGYQATNAIRSSSIGQRLPIIALTTQSLPGDRERCLAAGMDGYVPKPLEREVLAGEIEHVFRRRAPSRRAESAQTARKPTPAVAEEAPLLDRDIVGRLRNMGREDIAAIGSIVELFRSDGLRILSEIRGAAAARDVRALARLGHELIGSSGMCGATRMVSLTRSLKDAAKAEDFATVNRLLLELERTLPETSSALRSAFGLAREEGAR
jgi:two-component system, sensor histidine kinase and response regulator